MNAGWSLGWVSALDLEGFFISLARVLNEETVQPQNLQMMGMLLPLGIERGKQFKPDADTLPC